MRHSELKITDVQDIVSARGIAREAARQLGFGLADQTRLATAVSELTRNVLVHAQEGVCIVTNHADPQECRVQVVVQDNGPGIDDIERALTDGYTTKGGLGAGLPATRRLVHEFEIESRPGHTKVTIAIVIRR